MNKIFLTKKAKKNLLELDKKIQKRIIEKLEFFANCNNPLHYAKKLKNYRFGTYRFRISDYRVIFDINEDGKILILLILTIQHRKDVYKIIC